MLPARAISCLAFALLVLLHSPSARAAKSFVLLHDDGTIAAPGSLDTVTLATKVMALYDPLGLPRPDVLSIWTTFPMDSDSYETLMLPLANDVTGIGFETQFGGNGTFASAVPPVRAILLHNDVTQLTKRAQLQGAPVDGFAQYLFLLEFFHQWGPVIQVPSAGGPAGDLVGLTFHYSFWVATGGSPAGGNAWTDDGNGSFTTHGVLPGAMHYSMLDLYLMGLASGSEVPSFFVLENAVPPAGLTDPNFGGPYGAHSFPWFGPSSFTAQATARTLTINDVVTANGPRVPDSTSSPKSWKIAIALAIAPGAGSTEIAHDEAFFEPIAASLVPAFQAATGGRGTLDLVSSGTPGKDAGVGDAAVGDASGTLGGGPDATPGGDGASRPSTPNEAGGGAVEDTPRVAGGCGVAHHSGGPAPLIGLGLVAGLALLRRGNARMSRVHT